ncbi:MAG TPA: M14 metallopeptidase family protein [Longimicrobiales bacterium]|nr:M14 metallopeptidase family protein [Longimicrobiales bacterium]
MNAIHPLRPAALVSLLALLPAVPPASAQVPAPRDVFGFDVGEDRRPADYDQMMEYFRRLDGASDRVQMREIGRSARGRPLLLLFISSEDNIRQLDRWRTTSESLSRARIEETEARGLAREGRAVVWVDGGMDDQEFATAQMTPELAYLLVTDEGDEMRKIRDNVVVLLNPVLNPDGVDNDVGWYRENLGTPFETTRPPRLGQPWVGTDNNRDWFMANQPETRAISRVLYHEWYPQIVYNHHQTSPPWARIAIPPYSDPVNPDIHPGVTTGVNLVGTAMANRFAMKRMPGAVARVIYDMWWNGGMRLTPYYHNQIGILTETAHRTPTPRTYDLDDFPETLNVRKGEIPRTDSTSIFYPYPWARTESHIRDAVDYMLEATWATLNLAANYREELLFNIWRMGRDAIEKGSAEAPYAYVIPAEQRDATEARNLVNTLRYSGVEVHRATAPFQAGGTRYAAGDFVLYAAQAFRPHLANLMEPQRYPNRTRYPGGPPEPPYDLSGWTLPMQMGVRVDRVHAAFEASVAPVEDLAPVAAGAVGGGAQWGYALSPTDNGAVIAVNRLLADGETVGRSAVDGAFLIERGSGTEERVEALASELGLDFRGLAARPSGDVQPVSLPRVALYKPWHSRMDDQGWTLWMLEQQGFPVDTLHDADIRDGDLSGYDAIVFADIDADFILRGNPPGTMPDAYVGGLGSTGGAALKRFVEAGGTVLGFDKSTAFLIDQLGVPVRNVVEGLPDTDFFIPGSVLRMDVDTTHALARGMPGEAAAFFSRSRAFETIRLARADEGGTEEIPRAPEPLVDVVTRYADHDILMSGWALGEERLAGRAAMVRARIGAGDVVLFGFRPQHRGQSRGTYKLIFNALYESTVRRGRPATDGGGPMP